MMTMLKRMWLTLLSTKRICETRPQRSFWSGEGQHCLLKVLYFGIGIKCIVGLEVVLREIQLMAQSPGLKYYQFSWEGLLWDKQPFDFFFFSAGIHTLWLPLLSISHMWLCFGAASQCSQEHQQPKWRRRQLTHSTTLSQNKARKKPTKPPSCGF